MSDDYDSYDSYDDYDDYEADGGEYEYEDEDDGGAYHTSEFELENLARGDESKAAVPAKGRTGGNNRLRLILGVLIGIFVIIPLVCVVLPGLLGFAGLMSLVRGGEEPVAEVAIATFIPTAAVVLPDTPTPEPSPTPTPAPPSAVFISPSPDVTLSKGQSVNIEVQVEDGFGITSVSIEGSGLAPKTYSGETAVTFSQNWAPENAGFYTFAVIIRNRLGETNRLEGISVQVVDRDFIQRNAATFSTLDANVAIVRGLSLREPIEPVLMGVEGVKRYFRTEYTPADAHRDMLVMSSFDFVPRGFNLYEPAVEYSGSSIAGFYDSSNKLFVLVSTDNELDSYEQYVYVHELMHTLQDQHFSLSDLGDPNINQNSDRALALRALAEGEAMLLQERYLEGGYFSSDQRAEIQNISEIRIRTINQAQSRSQAPPIWGRLFYFPYEDGLVFARAIYNRGGWGGLNEAWGTPPISTEQILHPDRYFAGDLPLEVSVPDLLPTLGEGWEEIARTTLGELYLREYLGQRLDDATVNRAATGWGGDQYAVYWNEPLNRVVMTLRLAWDSTADSDEFASAYTQYADLAYGTVVTEVGDGIRCRTAVDTVCTYRLGDDWLIVRTTTFDLATAAMATMQE